MSLIIVKKDYKNILERNTGPNEKKQCSALTRARTNSPLAQESQVSFLTLPMRTAKDYCSFYISRILINAFIGSLIYATCLVSVNTCAEKELENGGMARLKAHVSCAWLQL